MSLLLNSVTAPDEWDIDPRTIPDCNIWFDAADTDTITGTSPVTAWRNKGSIVMNAVNDVGTCTSGSITINGRNVIQCPAGTNLAFTCALTTQPKTIFLVVRGHQQLTTNFFAPFTRGTASTTQTAILFSRSSSTSYHYNIGLAAWSTPRVNAQCAYQSTTTVQHSLRSPVPNFFNATRVYCCLNSTVANSNCISVNGIEYSPGTTPTSLTTSTSATGYDTANIKYLINTSDTSSLYNTGMDYCEIIYYGRALSVTERKTIESYLAWKWGVARDDVPNFSPITIPGCLAWYDADVDFNDAASRATSFTFSSGNSVQTWIDKSGNGRTATSASASRGVLTQNLLNGKCGWLAGGGATTTLTSPLSLGTTQSFTAFTVCLSTSGLSQRAVFTVNGLPGTTGGYMSLQQNTSAPPIWQWTGGTGFTGFTTGVTLGRPDIISAVWSPGSCQYTVNGLAQPISSITPTALTASAQLIISGLGSGTTIGNSWGGNIHEIIIYDGVLSGENRVAVEKYLSLKWNIPLYIGSISMYHPARLYKTLGRLGNPFDNMPAHCALWLDAADPSTITMSGSTVTMWSDKSGGNARTSDLVPVSGSNITMTTINGRPALSFNGSSSMSDDGLSIAGAATSLNWFIVANVTTTNPTLPALLAGLCYSGTGSAYVNTLNGLYVNANNLELKFRSVSGGTLTVLATVPISASTTFQGYSCTLSPANNQYHVGINGTKGTVRTITNFTQDAVSTTINLGYSGVGTAFESRLVGSIGEVLCFREIMTDLERQRVEGYLAWKWGLQPSLPATHPFASTTPLINGPKMHPMQVPNALLWLDASDIDGTGNLPASGTAVTKWSDKSGLARHCVQTTAALCPTFTYDGDYPAIQFNGSTQFLQANTPLLSGTALTAYSTFIVYRPTTVVNDRTVFFQANTALTTAEASAVYTRIFSANLGANTLVYSKYTVSTGAFKESGPRSATTNRTLVSIADSGTLPTNSNGNDYLFFFNGVNVGATSSTVVGSRSGTADNGRYIIGAHCFSSTFAGHFNGFVYEVIFFNRQVSDMERRFIEGYLAWKWGMNTTLPVTHPFYKINV